MSTSIPAKPGVLLSPSQRYRIRATLAWRKLKAAWVIFRESRLAIVGLTLILLFGVMAIAHPILTATVWPSGIYDPQTGYDSQTPHPSQPSSRHLLGTDSLGRDVLSMLLAATRPTFVLGLTAALTAAISGTIIGGFAGFYRGKVDALLSRLSDIFLLLPAPILMVIVGMRWRDLGPAPLGWVYGIFAGAGGIAIVMRSVAMKIRALPFIEASRSIGGGSLHIMARHVLPHMLPMAALQMLVAVTGAVVADGFISFFGFTRNINNWGTMIYNAFAYTETLGLTEPQWNVLLPPSLALSFFALAFYLVSRGVHRVADPRLADPAAPRLQSGWIGELKRRLSIASPEYGQAAAAESMDRLQPDPRLRATWLFARLHGAWPESAGPRPERGARRSGKLFREAIPIISQYGGAVTHIDGHSMVAVFGFRPHRVPAQVSALLATHAAIELTIFRTALNELRLRGGKPALNLSVGVATGYVRAQDMEPGAQHPVKAAAARAAHRLQQFTVTMKASGVFISEETHRHLQRVSDQFTFGRMGPASFPWEGEPVMVYEVTGRTQPLIAIDLAIHRFPRIRSAEPQG